jgi:hypothetical protein
MSALSKESIPSAEDGNKCSLRNVLFSNLTKFRNPSNSKLIILLISQSNNYGVNKVNDSSNHHVIEAVNH